MTVEVRPLPEDDWEAARLLGVEAFGGPGHPERFRAQLPHSLPVGAYDRGRLVAWARVKPYEQWFGGRPVRMAGVASVAVTASHQRRGVGRLVVSAALDLACEHGFPVSTLFPTTEPLYRSLGWERAGEYTWYDVPAGLLRDLGPVDGVELRPATEADLPAVFAAYRTLAAETAGLLERAGPFFDVSPAAVLESTVLVAEGERGVEGYSRSDRRWAERGVEVEATDVVATTPAAARALWFALGAATSTVARVRANVAADDVLPYLAEPRIDPHEHLRWMLRLVDAPAAVAARGWPAGPPLRVDLDLRDEQVPGNAGRWRLAVEDGVGTLTRGGDGSVALGVGALSALWSGYAAPRALRRAGLLACGDDAALDGLAAVTAGRAPRLLDYF